MTVEKLAVFVEKESGRKLVEHVQRDGTTYFVATEHVQDPRHGMLTVNFRVDTNKKDLAGAEKAFDNYGACFERAQEDVKEMLAKRDEEESKKIVLPTAAEKAAVSQSNAATPLRVV